MSEAIETIVIGNFTAKILYDGDAMNPRTEMSNVGTIICKSNKYGLGDENQTADMDDCNSWDEVEKLIRKEYGRDAIMLPVYIYDHSGITINTTGFSCGWDSGRIATIVVSREKARKEYGMKRITKSNLEKVLNYLKGEIETYDQYLTGEVYGYSITEQMVTDEGEEYDEDRESCWGYYGMECIKEDATSILESLSKNQDDVMEAN